MAQLFVSRTTQMIAANGLAVRFVAGVERPIHPNLVNIALAKGVVPAGEAPNSEAETPDRVPDVIEAIRALMEEGDTKAFSEKTGEPNLTALRKKAGFQVTDAERDAAWATVKDGE